ncbi:MAG: hypothetical protein Q4F25_06405, partial [Eubacteriales bacterium]|nr:hypothetical protein [Eubacteriales bacterium]
MSEQKNMKNTERSGTGRDGSSGTGAGRDGNGRAGSNGPGTGSSGSAAAQIREFLGEHRPAALAGGI